MDNIQKILDKWCSTFSVKFNTKKTEIILFRFEIYRTIVLESCKLNPLDQGLLDNKIKIVSDKNAIKSFSAWIENKTNLKTL